MVLPRPGVISELYREQSVADELFFEPGLIENPVEPWSRAMDREDFSASLPLRGLRAGGNVGRAAAAMMRLTRKIRAEKYDLIYCNGTNADFAGALLARLSGVPALWHVRYTSLPKMVRGLHDRLTAHASVRRILCVSRASAALFPHCPDKVRVIHNALDTAEFDPTVIRPVLRSELRLSEDDVVFGSQGRILPRKGYIEMIRAAEIALSTLGPEQRSRMHFVVLGDTPEDIQPNHLSECLRLVRELGLDDHVHFVGFRKDVKPYVADFDVAVVPSVYPDPLPRSVIESMAMAKPVIAFDVGGVAEMLTPETGALVAANPPDVAGLAAQFVRYFRDASLRQTQGQQGRARVLLDFDGVTQAAKIQDEIVTTSGLAR